MHRIVSVTSLAIALFGCTVPQPREVPDADKMIIAESISDMNSQQPEMSLPQNVWWHQLNDPLLDQLIRQAVTANPDLQSAYSSIREARAYYQQTESSRLPQASLSAGLSQQYNNQTEQRTDNYSASIDAQWEIDLFNQNLNIAKAAKESYLATQASYADALISLSAEVASNYTELRNQQNQLQTIEKVLQSWKQTWEMTEWQYKSGLTTRLAVEQAKRNYAEAKTTIPQYEAGIIELRYTLASLLGITEDQLPKSLDQLSALPQLSQNALTELPAKVINQRPDVRSARHLAQSASYSTAATEATLLPGFTLAGSISNATETLSKLFSLESILTSLGLNLTQTVLDNGQRQQQINIQKEQTVQALLNYKKIALAALSEVQLAAEQLKSNQAYLTELEKVLSISSEEARIALIQYQAGAAGFADVLTAQRSQLNLQQQYTQALSQNLKYRITLTKATMGEWAWQYTADKLATETKEIQDESSH